MFSLYLCALYKLHTASLNLRASWNFRRELIGLCEQACAINSSPLLGGCYYFQFVRLSANSRVPPL